VAVPWDRTAALTELLHVYFTRPVNDALHESSGRSVGVIVAYWVTQKNHRAVMSEKDVDGV